MQTPGASADLEGSDGQALASPVPPAAAQQASLPIWRRIPIRLAIVGLLILVGAIGSWINTASRSSTGDITKGGDLSAEKLRVGDCWDVKEPTASTIGKVTARPCSEGHQYELFFIESMPAGNYPSQDAFSTYVQANCLPAFGTYIGKDYEGSTLDFLWLYPSSDGWTGGDRAIECSAYDPGNDQLMASVKGSGQ